MRNAGSSLAVLVAAGAIALGAGCGERERPVTVATDTGFVPFEFIDTRTGELVGFDIDLIRAIADRAGFEIRIVTLDFDGIVAGVQSGRFDIGIAGMTITEARAETIDFSDPYYDAGLILAVRADETEIRSEADLAGRRVGTRTGTTSEDYLRRRHPDAQVVAFPGIVEAYMDLRAGRLDAVLYDVPNVRYYAAREGGGEIRTVGDVLQGEQYGIAFPKGSPLVAPVNDALRELRADSTFDRLHETWFGDPEPEE